ncbi:hypothetical protein TNCV_590391 [Trichonephila clavipes]|nr:hypothetical protein TNCV_590391 [Trichonephila clavipes]
MHHGLHIMDVFTIVATNIATFVKIFQKTSVMSRRKQQSAFDQVSEFDRGRVVAYRDCRLSFREIGTRVG